MLFRSDWIQDDAPRGNNRRALPNPPSFPVVPPAARAVPAKAVSGATTLDRPLVLDGLLPEKITSNQSIRITAALPDGRIEPLIWLHQYDGRNPASISLPEGPQTSGRHGHPRRAKGCRCWIIGTLAWNF